MSSNYVQVTLAGGMAIQNGAGSKARLEAGLWPVNVPHDQEEPQTYRCHSAQKGISQRHLEQTSLCTHGTQAPWITSLLDIEISFHFVHLRLHNELLIKDKMLACMPGSRPAK